jgi:hypothetical protein
MAKNTKLKKLRKLQREYSGERRGYRDRQYQILAETMAIVVEIRGDEAATEAFSQLSKKVRPAGSQDSKSWITGAAVAYVTGAKSENAIKIAWKRARGLDHLHDFHGIPPEDIAAEIRKRGGIEAIARIAAEEDPRRQKSESDVENGGKTKTGKATSGKEPHRPLKAASADEHVSGEDSNDEPDDEPDSSTVDDGTMLVGISADLSAELKAVAGGEPVKLIGTRTGDWGESFLFEVEKVVALVRKRRLRWGKPAKAKRKP